jgi:hypothetical protein
MIPEQNESQLNQISKGGNFKPDSFWKIFFKSVERNYIITHPLERKRYRTEKTGFEGQVERGSNNN